MKDVILIGDGEREEVRRTADDLTGLIENHCNLRSIDLDEELDLRDVTADLVITLGGDGSVLQATHRMGSNQIPLLGINLGKLGFLSAIETEELDGVLPDLLRAEDLETVSRVRLQCELRRNDEEVARYSALNDVVVTRGGISRMVSLEIQVDGERMTSFDGDGIVVATPTGSTAHNLSAGGPVIEPTVEGIVITPLAPHTLTLRPLVISSDRTVRIQVTSPPEEAMLTVDGQQFVPLEEEDRIRITEANPPAELVQPPNRSFYHTLNKKLQWGVTPLSNE